MEYDVKILLPDGEEQEKAVTEDMTYEAMAREVGDKYPAPIVLAMADGKLHELSRKIKKVKEISFITMTESDGKRTYRRSVILLLQEALNNLYGERVHARVLYSLGQGYYCELVEVDKENGGIGETLEFTSEKKREIQTEMLRMVKEDLLIKKITMKTQEAEERFHQLGMYDKEKLLYYRRSSSINLYQLGDTLDYFYGYMVPSTGYLKCFDLVNYDEGFVLLYPNKDASKVEPLETSNKLHKTLHASREWSRMLGVGCVGELNEAIAKGRGQELILTQEALMEEKIGNLAQQIVERPDVKFVMIAGPSSSGKTSFANRLSIQLTAKGKRPHPVSLDDYYADREKCPRNPDGSFDFECLEALDVEQFNQDMHSLLHGGTVDMPSFNFKTGKREYRGRKLKLGEGDLLVIEGIHGLNERMSYMLPAESKFRIYISALTQLNIDEHNPISTTDGRLLRRITRDARTRGTSAQETIAMWPSVRRGEEKNIFPYQEGADVIFNSALCYELAVLKVYAEPLLFQIPRDAKEYLEAKRLLKFLDYFLPLSTDGICQNSLAREFVGGSIFNV